MKFIYDVRTKRGGKSWRCTSAKFHHSYTYKTVKRKYVRALKISAWTYDKVSAWCRSGENHRSNTWKKFLTLAHVGALKNNALTWVKHLLTPKERELSKIFISKIFERRTRTNTQTDDLRFTNTHQGQSKFSLFCMLEVHGPTKLTSFAGGLSCESSTTRFKDNSWL